MGNFADPTEFRATLKKKSIYVFSRAAAVDENVERGQARHRLGGAGAARRPAAAAVDVGPEGTAAESGRGPEARARDPDAGTRAGDLAEAVSHHAVLRRSAFQEHLSLLLAGQSGRFRAGRRAERKRAMTERWCIFIVTCA